MNDRLRDLPRMKELAGLRQFVQGVLAVVNVARPIVRLAGKDVEAFDRRIAEWSAWEQQAADLVSVPDRFNQFFGARGWIMYETINFELAKTCVEKAEAGNVDAAERDLVEAITPDNIRWKLMLMSGIRAFRPRAELAEKARVDYAEGRYYASVLVTLSLLDGLVNDLHQRQIGFFAKDVDLNAWNSMSAHGTGLERLSRLLQEPRTKTRTNAITLPYRHGIVHGRDLGYDNKMVAAKSWVALFSIRDWALKSEQGKLEPPPLQKKQGSRQTLRTLATRLRHHVELHEKNEALRALVQAWRPRDIEVAAEYRSVTEPSDLPDGTPERAVLEFFSFLRKGNYGGLVRSMDPDLADGESVNRTAGAYRRRFENTRIHDVRLVRIADQSPAISLVSVQVRGQFRDQPFDREFELRLVYRGEDRSFLPGGAPGGAWRIFFLPDLPSAPLEKEDDV
ncbi:hypothetical protein [Pendulispora albinea]|uniref:Uncharacterized protein n=1 Tax=Pendulispora albinea TaxID=2741071 RepID=A0ABZ2MAY6_9BACT